MPDPIDTASVRSAYRGMPGHLAVDRLCDEVDRLRERNLTYARDLAALRAENEALRAITGWAKDAPHHDWCDARFNDPPPRRLDAGRPSYPCKCGRDALAALEADR